MPDGIEELYGYDAAGEKTSIDYRHGGSGLGAIDYAYDSDGQLEAMSGSYARASLPEPLATTEYNEDNEMTEREGEALSYDKDGNLTSDGANEYSWDARGQLTEISGATTAAFGYDPFGRRISKTLEGTTTELLYDEANVAQESVEGSPTGSLLNGPQPDQLFSRTTTAGTSSYLTDRLGSIVALANESGEVKTGYIYDPFGATSSFGAASDNSYQFTGRENDDTGLQYNRARYYSPSMGRFISQDPTSFAGSGPNLYWYANGDPLDLIDPSGEGGLEIGPFSIGNPFAPVEEAGHEIGHWISGAPAVASEVAHSGVGEWIGDRGNEFGRTFTCIAERVVQHPGPVGCQEEAERLKPEPESPEPPNVPPPPGAPGTNPAPIP